MTFKIQTPQEVWKDYDPNGAPLDEECMFESVEVNRARTVRDYVFLAEASEDGAVKVFCRAVTPFHKKGVVVFVEDYDRRNNQPLIDSLSEQGWAVLLPDYGDRTNCGTKFPASLAYGKLSAGRERLFKMLESAKDTCQYLYEKIIKRTISFAEKIYPGEKLCLLGAGSAAELAVAVAGSDPRVGALVLINGGLYREYLARNRFDETANETMDDHTVGWMSSVASVAYAKNVTCPTLLLAGTNASRFDCDRLQTMHQLLKNAKLDVYLTPGGAETVAPEGYRTLSDWLNRFAAGEKSLDHPDAKIRFEDGAYSVYVKTDLAEKPERIRVCYAFNEYDHRYRNWRVGEAKSISDQGEYLFSVPSKGCGSALFAFAEVRYPSETLSSIVLFSDEKDENAEVYGSNLVLAAKDGMKHFRAETDEELLTEYARKEIVTPSGLYGVTSYRGALVTYVVNEPRASDENAVLQFNFYTETKKEVRIRAVFLSDDRNIAECYTATAEVLGARDAFSTVGFSAETFKNVDMLPMERWNGVKALYIEAKGVAIGNILFI